MEKGYFHQDLGYWQTIGKPSAAALRAYPAGTVEVPLKPAANMEWDGAAWIAVESESVEQWREFASLDRRAFCIWLLRAGVLTADESVAAARGDWPQAFSDALAGLSENVQAEAQIEWATAVNIRRNHPLLETLRKRAGIPHEVLDEAFGYTAE